MRRQLTYVFILVGAVLAILSGCQKEEVAPTSNALTSIGRLDAERLLAAWNIQQKGRLKSATALTVTEGMWQKSKVSVFAGEQSSFISVPFTARITLVFADRGGCQKLFFLEARPSTSEPAAISASSFTGYVVVYDSQLAPIVALRYELGRFASYHDVRKRTSYNKSAEDGGIALTGEIAEVVITPKPKPTQPPASPTGEPDPVRPVEVISWIERDEFGGGDPGLDLLSDSQLDQLSPHERANAQLAWMDTHGGKDAVTAILRVAYAAGLTESDKAKIYQAIDAAYKSLKGQYIMAVFRPVAETLKPVLELVLLENISEGLVKGIAAMVGALSSERLTFFLIDKGDGNVRSLTRYGDDLYLFNREHAFNNIHTIPNSGGQYTTFSGTGLTADGVETTILRSLEGGLVPYLPNTRLGRVTFGGYEVAYTFGRKADGTVVISDYYIIK